MRDPQSRLPASLISITGKPEIACFGCGRRFWLWGWCVAGVLVAQAVWVCLGTDIEFNNRTATFTNLQGRVYENVQLQRATGDGLIYSQTNTGTIGMVRYSDLPTNFLANLKIPDSLVAEAAQRQTRLAIEKQQYDEASRLLAEQERTNNAVRSSMEAPAPTPVAKANPKPVGRRKKPVHHHRRRR